MSEKPITLKNFTLEELQSYRDQVQDKRDSLSRVYCGRSLSLEDMEEAKQALDSSSELLQSIDGEISRKAIADLHALRQSLIE